MGTATEWRKWLKEKNYRSTLNVFHPELVGILEDLERREDLIAVYKEDRLALITRIAELETEVNWLKDQVDY